LFDRKLVTPSSQKIPLYFFFFLNKFFLVFKSAQVFVLPLRAALALIGLVFARKRGLLILTTPGIFLNLLFSTFMYSYCRLLIDSYLSEKDKQKQIDQET